MSALLSEILDPKLVVLELREQTAAEAILEIVERLRDAGLVQDFYKLADAVMEREGRSSTNTGEGVAFRMRARTWWNAWFWESAAARKESRSVIRANRCT